MNSDFAKYHIRDKENVDLPSTKLLVSIVVPVVLITVFCLVSFCIRTKLVSQMEKYKLEQEGTDLPPNYADLELPGVALDFTPCQPPSYEDISNEKRSTHLAKNNNPPSYEGIEMVSETPII